MSTLFDVEVPADAVRVIIRPILGPGGSMPLYDGPLDEETNESEIVAAASQNVVFWQYVARKKNVPPAQLYAWRLKLCFMNQSQVPEHRTTEGTHEFFCSLGGEGGEQRDREPQEDAIARISAMAMQTLHAVSASCTQMVSQVATAANAPLMEAVKAVTTMQQAELETRKDLMESVAVLSMDRREPSAPPPAPEPDLFDNLLKLGGLFVAASKFAEHLKRNKGDTN